MYKFVQQIINSKQWVDILLGLLIQCTIVDSHSQLSSLLPNEDDWTTPWATGWLNPSLSQTHIHLPSHLFQFSCRNPILASVVRFSIREKLNAMHSISIHWHARWMEDIMELLH